MIDISLSCLSSDSQKSVLVCDRFFSADQITWLNNDQLTLTSSCMSTFCSRWFVVLLRGQCRYPGFCIPL